MVRQYRCACAHTLNPHTLQPLILPFPGACSHRMIFFPSLSLSPKLVTGLGKEIWSTRGCVTDFKTYSNRVIKMEIHLQGKDSVTAINAYSPRSISIVQRMKKWTKFYDQLERAMADCDSK